MQSSMRFVLAVCLVGWMGCAALADPEVAPARASVVMVVLDGLRPDYVTAETMPNLYALAGEGAVCERHHAAFPSVTRVNTSTVATGCYPARHGIMGNSVYFPEVSKTKGLSTGSAGNLIRIEEATGGRLLTAPSLGERLQAAGKTLFVASSGSSGSAMLLNHKFSGCGVANAAFIRPDALREQLEKTIGPAPKEATPNSAQNHWAVDAYLEVAQPQLHPDAAILWLSDPDHTAHEAGIGAPKTLEALRAVDAEVGRLVGTLRERGLDQTTDLFVLSDHGFSTNTGGNSLAKLLLEAGLKQGPESEDVVVVEGSIYVQGHEAERIAKIVMLLQATPEVGAIFTKAAADGGPNGSVPGTLSLGLVHLDHERAPDILVSESWSDATNAFGYPGTAANGGVAGHGSSSPYDMHPFLMAIGPDIRGGLRSPVPTGQVDLLPTVCRLLGLPAVEGVDGRVLNEILKDGGDPPQAEEVIGHTSAPTATGQYSAEAKVVRVGKTEYLDWVRGQR